MSRMFEVEIRYRKFALCYEMIRALIRENAIL